MALSSYHFSSLSKCSWFQRAQLYTSPCSDIFGAYSFNLQHMQAVVPHEVSFLQNEQKFKWVQHFSVETRCEDFCRCLKNFDAWFLSIDVFSEYISASSSMEHRVSRVLLRLEKFVRMRLGKRVPSCAFEWTSLHHEITLYPRFPGDWTDFETLFEFYNDLLVVVPFRCCL